MQYSPEQLHFYHKLLGFLRVKRCRRVFKTTLQQNGKAYKQKCIWNLYILEALGKEATQGSEHLKRDLK